MNRPIEIPQLGPKPEKAVLVSWHKKAGETVKPGDVLFELETDKVVSEVEAEAPGCLENLTVQEGDEVMPGDVVGFIVSE